MEGYYDDVMEVGEGAVVIQKRSGDLMMKGFSGGWVEVTIVVGGGCNGDGGTVVKVTVEDTVIVGGWMIQW